MGLNGLGQKGLRAKAACVSPLPPDSPGGAGFKGAVISLWPNMTTGTRATPHLEKFELRSSLRAETA
jgi:hypothetical protein